MLLVKTKIGPSKIQGIGLFANQFIPKGTQIWKFEPGLDLRIDKAKIDRLPDIAYKQFLNYDYLNAKTNRRILCFDDARFFNHSDKPNCKSEGEYEGESIDVAARDIKSGEELTVDYRDYDAAFDYKMSQK